MLSSLRYFLNETWANIACSRHTTIITVLQTLVSLFVLGIFLVIIITVNRFVSSFLNNLQMNVFLADNLDANQQIAIKDALVKLEGIKRIEYISKEDAKEWMKKNSTFNLEGILEERNPLPASFRIYITSPRIAPELDGVIRGIAGVTDVIYGKEQLDRWLPIFYFLLLSSFILALVIAGATIFTISNTIRLAIYARRREIKIMQLVGATDWAIKVPFLLEGLIYGIGGGISAFLVVSLGYLLVYRTMQAGWLFRPLMVSAGQMAYNLFILMCVLGALIGVAGSLISVDKYLEDKYAGKSQVKAAEVR